MRTLIDFGLLDELEYSTPPLDRALRPAHESGAVPILAPLSRDSSRWHHCRWPRGRSLRWPSWHSSASWYRLRCVLWLRLCCPLVRRGRIPLFGSTCAALRVLDVPGHRGSAIRAFRRLELPGPPARRPPRTSRCPSVSILIPAFNEQEIILDAIGAALAQDYPDFEVIVIDDGSTDLTAHLAATTGVRLVRHEHNQGKAAALNSGLAVARGEVIVTNDADGYLDVQVLARLVAPLAQSGVAAVSGQVRLFHPKGSVRAFQVLEYDYCQGLLKQAQYATTGTVMVAPGPVSAFRAAVLRDVGGFSSKTMTEDFDLTLELDRARVPGRVRAAGHRLHRSASHRPRTAPPAHPLGPWRPASLRQAPPLALLGKLGLLGILWLPYSLLSWYAPVPLAILGIAILPLLAWGSGEPVRFFECLALYALPILLIELARITAGVVCSSKRDLRFLIHAPLFLVYQRLRLDWFSFESLYLEWRHRPKVWDD